MKRAFQTVMVSPVVAVKFVDADGVMASVAAGEVPKYDDDECCTIVSRMKFRC